MFVKELTLGGKKLVLETGELAAQAQAAVLATYGETVVLSTVVSQPAPADLDFFPLAVDYEERLYAGGKFLRLGLLNAKEHHQRRRFSLPDLLIAQ